MKRVPAKFRVFAMSFEATLDTEHLPKHWVVRKRVDVWLIEQMKQAASALGFEFQAIKSSVARKPEIDYWHCVWSDDDRSRRSVRYESAPSAAQDRHRVTEQARTASQSHTRDSERGRGR